MAVKKSSTKRSATTRLVREAVQKYQGDQDMLIQILLDLQSTLGWLPRETLEDVSRQLQVPLTRVYQIATYYKAFSLAPRGRHIIKVCLGTACQVRGSPRLLDTICTMLNLRPNETSKDMRFTLETVNCLGCCAMGPVIVVDRTYYGKPSTSDLKKILEAAK
jgi:NADH-quinone oxidoreductase subunit E